MPHGKLRVLIVEDEPLIGMELEDAVTTAGHEIIGWATSHASAIAISEARSPDLAFIDLKLRDGDTGVGISQQLAKRGVVVVLTTANSSDVGDLEHVLGIVSKPYSAETIHAVLRHAVEKLEAVMRDRPSPLASLRGKVLRFCRCGPAQSGTPSANPLPGPVEAQQIVLSGIGRKGVVVCGAWNQPRA
jgi:two-component system, response regulator PdtaR